MLELYDPANASDEQLEQIGDVLRFAANQGWTREEAMLAIAGAASEIAFEIMAENLERLQ